MIFGKNNAPGLNEIDLRAVPGLEQASEFLRMWATASGSVVCLIDPARLNPDPFSFGIALVDCARHGAKAWAAATGVSEEQAMARIWEGFDAERDDATDLPTQTNHSKAQH